MKKRKFIIKLILLIPAFLACMSDLVITSINQPKGYWNGNLQMTDEANPIVDLFMKNNSLGIFIFVLLWITLVGILSYFLKPKSFRALALFVSIAHTLGASTWIEGYYGFWYVIIFVLFISILFIIMEDIYISKNIVLENYDKTTNSR